MLEYMVPVAGHRGRKGGQSWSPSLCDYNLDLLTPRYLLLNFYSLSVPTEISPDVGAIIHHERCSFGKNKCGKKSY